MNILKFGGRTDIRPAYAKLVLFSFFLPSIAFAKWSQTYEFETWAVHNVYQTDVLGESFADDDLVARAEARLRYRNNAFTFTADPQLRFLATYLETNTNYSTRVHTQTIRAPDRAVKLETPLGGDDSGQFPTELQASFERLTLGFKTRATELSIGRQPFSLGLMKVVPIWNRYVVNLPVPGVYLQFPNRDGAAFRYQYGLWNLQAYSILENDTAKNAYLIENTFNFDSLELRILGGEWAKNLSGGFAAAVPLFDGSLRGEFLGVGARSDDPIQMYQWALGYETALSAAWKITIESLFLSEGERDSKNYKITNLHFFRPLLAEEYVVMKVRYESESFFSIEPTILVNLDDGSMLLGGDLTYSLGDHSEVALQGILPTGGRGQEFSANAMPLGSFGPTGTSQQVFVRYKLTY